MEFFPVALKTSPVSPVLITGCPELHSQLEAFFSKTLRPPVLVLKHAAEASDLEAFYRRTTECSPLVHRLCSFAESEKTVADLENDAGAEGMLNVTWMRELRTSHPVVIAMFIPRADVDSSPQKWSALLARMQAVRKCCEVYRTRFIAVVVCDEMKDLPLEVVSTFRMRFGLDENALLSLLAINVDPNDPSVVQLANNELKTIGQALLDNAWTVHQEHVKDLELDASYGVEPHPQDRVRECCKVAFLDEFKQDWASAVSNYSAAYRHLLELLSSQKLRHSLLLETLYVAEFLTMKICLLLMHQNKGEDAAKQFRIHLSNFRLHTEEWRTGLQVFFLGWLSRQYEIIIEIVSQRTTSIRPFLSTSITSRRHLANLYFYAADAAVQQRRAVANVSERLASTKLTVYDFVVPSSHWGRFDLKSDDAFKPVPEDVLDDYLVAVESNKALQAHGIGLLQSCLLQLKQAKVARKAAHVSAILAEEQVAAGEVHAGRENLLHVSDIYRRDGWNYPLSAALRLLIEISSESFWEKAIYSLELATLGDAADIAERSAFAQSGINSLLTERSEASQSKLWEAESSDAEPPPRRANVKGDFRDIGWSSIIEIVCGFQAVHRMNTDVHFGVALKNNLPVPLPIVSLSVRFLEHKGQSRMIKFSDAQSIELRTGQWKEFLTCFVPTVHGEMRVESIEVHFGPQASLMWHPRLTSRPKTEQEIMEIEHIEHLPFRDSIVCPGLHSIRIKHVGASPALTVQGPQDLYLGEVIFVTVQLTCDAEFEGESLRLDLSCDNSLGNPQWMDKTSAILEIKDIQLTAEKPWKECHQVMVHSFGMVTARATLKLNSETALSQSLSFEVKEPFFVESRVLAPPATYLFLPSPYEYTPNPLMSQPAGSGTRPTAATSTICIAEGSESFVQLAIKCKADCELALLEVDYDLEESGLLEVKKLSGRIQGVPVRRGDVHSMVFKIKPRTAFTKAVTAALRVLWKRKHEMPQMQLTSSLQEESSSIEVPLSGENPEAKTTCRLHDIVTQKPLLTARCQPPGAVQTGCPFVYALVLHNETALPEEFEISIADVVGCLFSGDRTSQVTIASQQQSQLQWQCVMHTPGKVRLPKISIASPRLKCCVEMEGMEIFVQPS